MTGPSAERDTPRALRRPIWQRFAGLIFDGGWVFSYVLFPRSYRLYRAYKYFGNWLFGRAEPVSPPLDWNQIGLVIDGFRHSGNTFLTDNLLPEWRPRTASIIHRCWVLAGAAQRGLPAFLLIRDPLEVAWSRRHRVMADPKRATYGVVSSLGAAMLCWYLYYGCAWRLREHLVVLPFPMLSGDYPALRARIEAHIGPALAPEPSFLMQNRFDSQQPRTELSGFERWLLQRCQRRYDRFMELARAESLPKGP